MSDEREHDDWQEYIKRDLDELRTSSGAMQKQMTDILIQLSVLADVKKRVDVLEGNQVIHYTKIELLTQRETLVGDRARFWGAIAGTASAGLSLGIAWVKALLGRP